jgi:hypothetical protein
MVDYVKNGDFAAKGTPEKEKLAEVATALCGCAHHWWLCCGTTDIHMQVGNYLLLPFCGILNRNTVTSYPYLMKKMSMKWNQSRRRIRVYSTFNGKTLAKKVRTKR